VSFEVLARWSDPIAGEISPAAFIPRLEHHKLIETFSDALMAKACCLAASWPGAFSLAFNISPLQLIAHDFPQKLAKLIASTQFPLNRIELEVTESLLIADYEEAYAKLRELNDLGIRIAIDDFGTGYSSLARL